MFSKGSKVRVNYPLHPYHSKIGSVLKRSGQHYNVVFVIGGKTKLICLHHSHVAPAFNSQDFHAGIAVMCIDELSHFYLRQGTLFSINDEVGLVDFGDKQLNLLGEPTPIHHCIHLTDLQPIAIPQPGNRKRLRVS